jgi:glutathione gamma-glutamylcysteinyltransferase
LFESAVQISNRKEGLLLIANYSRQTLGQTGDGHFTPIGGYCEDERRALLLDTARFKYPPHWASLEILYQALNTEDRVSGAKRGYMLVSRK